MATKGLAVLLATAAIAAAAAGGYVALRRNGADAIAALPKADQAAGEPAAARISGSAPAVTPAARPAPAARNHAGDRTTAKRPPVSAPATTAPAAAADTIIVNPESAPSAAASAPADAPRNEPKEASRTEPVPAPVYEPAKTQIDELTIDRDSVIGIRLDSTIASETARVEDRVTGHVSRDVIVNGHTAISSGARVEGVIVSVDRGGRFKDRARIGLRFQSLVLADGTRLPIDTEPIFRESESPAAPAASKVGATAAIGGILGAVLGGKKGAAIGAAVGAGGGSAAVAASQPASAVLPAGTPLTVRLTTPITVSVQRQEE